MPSSKGKSGASPQRARFEAIVNFSSASVQVDDDPDSWKSVKKALQGAKSLVPMLEVIFDGDLDNPENFDELKIVAGSIEYGEWDAKRACFSDLAFRVEGKAVSADPDSLEDLFHAFVIRLAAGDASVNVGDWESYSIEAVEE
jgi:hypothetical protein